MKYQNNQDQNNQDQNNQNNQDQKINFSLSLNQIHLFEKCIDSHLKLNGALALNDCNEIIKSLQSQIKK